MDTNFTAKEKVLVHILNNSGDKEAYALPEEVTQEGIAKSVGLKQNTVSYAVRKLVEEELLNEKTRRIKGKKQKRKAYFLTDEGIKEAKKTKEKIAEAEVKVEYGGQKKVIKIGEINAFFQTNFSYLEILKVVEKEGFFNIEKDDDGEDRSYHNLFYNKPKVEQDSIPELKKVIELIENDKKIISIKGSKESGKTTLLSELAEKRQSQRDVFYFKVQDWHDPMHFWLNISNFLKKCGQHRLSSYIKSADEMNRREWLNNLVEDIKNTEALLILDDLDKNKQIYKIVKDIVYLKVDDSPLLLLYSKTSDEDEISFESETSITLQSSFDTLENFKDYYDASKDIDSLMDLLGNYVTDEEFWSLALLSVLREAVEKSAVTQLRPVTSKMVDNLVKTPMIKITTDNKIMLHSRVKEVITEELNMDEKRWLHEIAFEHYSNKPEKKVPSIIEELYHIIGARKNDLFEEKLKTYENDLLCSGFYHSILHLIEKLEKSDSSNYTKYIKAEAFRKIEEHEKAISIYNEIIKESSDRELIVKSYIGKASAEVGTGELDLAEESYLEAKDISDDLESDLKGNKLKRDILYKLGSLLNDKKEHKKAQKILSKVIDMTDNDHSILTNSHFMLARIKKLNGDWEDSISYFQKGLEHWKQIKGTYQRVGGLKEIGALYSILRELKNAEDYLKEAVETSERFGYYDLKASASLSLTECYLEKGDLERAVNTAKEARDLFDELGHDKPRAFAHNLLSKTYMMQGNLDEAERELTKAISIYQRKGLSYRLGLAYFSLAKIQEKKENKQGVAENYRKAILSFSGSGASWMAEEVEKEMENIPLSM